MRRHITMVVLAGLANMLAAAGAGASQSKDAHRPAHSSGSTLAPSCTFSQLKVSSSSDSGAGHIGVIVVFTNSSRNRCSLKGYPQVAALNAAGGQAAQATQTLSGYLGGVPAGHGHLTVTLRPGQSASATIEGTNVPVGSATSCPTYPSLRVTAPNVTKAVTVKESMPGCSPLHVHPVVAGASGSIPD